LFFFPYIFFYIKKIIWKKKKKKKIDILLELNTLFVRINIYSYINLVCYMDSTNSPWIL